MSILTYGNGGVISISSSHLPAPGLLALFTSFVFSNFCYERNFLLYGSLLTLTWQCIDLRWLGLPIMIPLGIVVQSHRRISSSPLGSNSAWTGSCVLGMGKVTEPTDLPLCGASHGASALTRMTSTGIHDLQTAC